jgi:PAS domain S-box-containing protein
LVAGEPCADCALTPEEARMPASRRDGGPAASTAVRLAPPDGGAPPPEPDPSGVPSPPRTAGLDALAASLGIGFERATVGMALLDLDGRVVRANRSLCELLGRSAAELAGRSMLALVRREDRADLVGRVTAALESGEEALRPEYRCVLGGGRAVEVAVSVAVLRDGDGEPRALLAECHDLTALGRAERDRRSLLRQLVTAQEDERRRLAANLHDDTIQTLAAALLLLDVLQARVDRAVDDRAGGSAGEALEVVRFTAERIRHNVEHSLQSARTFLFDLRPLELDVAGLETAVRRQLDRLAVRSGWSVELRWTPGGVLDRDRETILFRALQEVLANVARHAGATAVSIRAWRVGGMVAVEVADDGAGFDPDETLAMAPASGHLGLRFTAERIECAGGALRVQAAPGQGARVEVRLPASTPPGQPGT